MCRSIDFTMLSSCAGTKSWSWTVCTRFHVLPFAVCTPSVFSRVRVLEDNTMVEATIESCMHVPTLAACRMVRVLPWAAWVAAARLKALLRVSSDMSISTLHTAHSTQHTQADQHNATAVVG